MRIPGMYHRIKFYPKVTTRDDYSASSDSWPLATVETRGGIRYSGGAFSLSTDEKFYAKSMELTIRYRPEITETMRVQIDDFNYFYGITYIEELGRKEALRLTLEKLNEEIPVEGVDPPTDFSVLFDTDKMILTWTNNSDDDAVSIERSGNGNVWVQVHRTAKEVELWEDEDIEEAVRYFYRARAFKYRNYSDYTIIDDGIWT